MKQRYENIILITLDSLRWDAIFSKNGKINSELSFLNAISRNSIIFTNAFANGAGTPACFPSITTSTYPLMYGGYRGISRRRIPISEVLQKEGFHTIGILNNAYLSKYFGYDRGFDIFYDFAEKEITLKKRILYKISKLVHTDPLLLDLSQAINMFLDINPPYLEGCHINRYISSLIKIKEINKPFFLHLHYMDAHLPYYSSNIDYSRYQISNGEIRKLHFKIFAYPHMRWLLSKKELAKVKLLYTLKVRYLDSQLENLFKILSKNNLLSNTLVILMADHGEEFMEHGDLVHLPKLYDELIHIPLIIFSKEIKGPIWVDSLVEQLDIAPTISYALGIMPPKQYLGKNLLDVYGNNYNRELKKNYVISEVAQPKYRLEIDYSKRIMSIRTKKFKFIWRIGHNKHELYNIKMDPLEKNNIAEKNTEIVTLLKEIAYKHILKERISFIKTKIDDRKILSQSR